MSNSELFQRIEELKALHLADDDEHGMDCKRDHQRPMLELNPEGCGACRIFAALSMPA